MLSLYSSIRSICHLSVLNIRLVVSVNALKSPSVIILFGNMLEVASNSVGTDDAHREHIAIVHKQKASSEVGPGERHINY